MSDWLPSLDEALGRLQAVAGQVPGRELERESPCDGWTVRDVMAHVLGVIHKFSDFAEGITDAPRTPRIDLLGDDHIVSVDREVVRARAAWSQTDSTRTCTLPFGVFAAQEAAGIVLFDVVAHTWDISHAVGVDAGMGDHLWVAGLEAAQHIIGPRRDPNHYGSPRTPPPGASPEVAFLAFLGRPG